MLNNTLRTLFIGLVSTAMALGATAIATSATPAFANVHTAPIAVSIL